MIFTLQTIADNPEILTETLTTSTGEEFVLRPLMPTDVQGLTLFLQSLAEETRRFSTFASYDKVYAQELCDAIARYDKLRLVLMDGDVIAGLLEFSFDLVESDKQRYSSYGITLNDETDCRFGITIADAYQDKKLGTCVIPKMFPIAEKFGQKRVILWGGVLADNPRAIRVYEKCGFAYAGQFINENIPAIDMIYTRAKDD